jgi:EpsI family protein
MNLERLSLWVAVPLLAGFGILSWVLLLQDPLDVDWRRLGELPLRVGDWQGTEIDLDSGVEEILDADFNLQRRYHHPLGDYVWLYVGYYGTERGGRPEHTPWQCYPSAGWVIVRSEVVDAVPVAGQPPVQANELLVERSGERRLVHFWYQSVRRSGMLGGLDQTFDRFASRIRFGRADGSLVRFSTPIGGAEDEDTARERLRVFAREIFPLLETHWPEEARVIQTDAPRLAAAFSR